MKLSEAFLGLILVLFGLQILFGFVFPLLRIILGIAIIYWGFHILVPDWSQKTRRNHKKSGFYSTPEPLAYTQQSHTTLFGTETIEISKDKADLSKPLSIQTIFGKTYVIIDQSLPFCINAKARMGNIIFPDNTEITRGSYTYEQSGFGLKNPVQINITAVFGTIRILHKR